MRGVYFRKDVSAWRAEISFASNNYCIGYFSTRKEAEKAKTLAEKRRTEMKLLYNKIKVYVQYGIRDKSL